jgi:hypothetical protein
MGTALVAALTACSAGTAGSARKEALVPQLEITPRNGMLNVVPGAGIIVRATNGTVRNVRVQTGGDPVTGRLSDHATTWRSQHALNTSRRFTVVATALGSGGKTITVSSSFTTLKPRKSFDARTLEGYQQRYGVGMPIILNFSRPITRKAAVEQAIHIKTTKRVVGDWYWDGDKTLYFRPRPYWPQHTRVSFDARFNGVQGAPGVYGTHDLTQTFEIGSSRIAATSTRTHPPDGAKTHACCGGYWPTWLDDCLGLLWSDQELCTVAAKRAQSTCARAPGRVDNLGGAPASWRRRWLAPQRRSPPRRPMCAA